MGWWKEEHASPGFPVQHGVSGCQDNAAVAMVTTQHCCAARRQAPVLLHVFSRGEVCVYGVESFLRTYWGCLPEPSQSSPLPLGTPEQGHTPWLGTPGLGRSLPTLLQPHSLYTNVVRSPVLHPACPDQASAGPAVKSSSQETCARSFSSHGWKVGALRFRHNVHFYTGISLICCPFLSHQTVNSSDHEFGWDLIHLGDPRSHSSTE